MFIKYIILSYAVFGIYLFLIRKRMKKIIEGNQLIPPVNVSIPFLLICSPIFCPIFLIVQVYEWATQLYKEVRYIIVLEQYKNALKEKDNPNDSEELRKGIEAMREIRKRFGFGGVKITVTKKRNDSNIQE